MATDKSEPRVGLIFKIGLLVILTLVVVHTALGAYFNSAVQAEESRKFGEIKPEALLSLREQEKERLSAGSMPIDKAMDQLARQGRKGLGPELAPTASKDMSALQGWIKMPIEVPTAMVAASEASAIAMDAGKAPPPAGAAPDGGAMKAGDAGAATKNP